MMRSQAIFAGRTLRSGPGYRRGREGAALLQSFSEKSLKIGAKLPPARRSRAFGAA
jgi:hypothetical protein